MPDDEARRFILSRYRKYNALISNRGSAVDLRHCFPHMQKRFSHNVAHL